MISCQQEFDRTIDSLPVGTVVNKFDLATELNGKFWTMGKIEHYLSMSKKLAKVERCRVEHGSYTNYRVLPRG